MVLAIRWRSGCACLIAPHLVAVRRARGGVDCGRACCGLADRGWPSKNEPWRGRVPPVAAAGLPPWAARTRRCRAGSLRARCASQPAALQQHCHCQCGGGAKAGIGLAAAAGKKPGRWHRQAFGGRPRQPPPPGTLPL